jgi:hypothetical protein
MPDVQPVMATTFPSIRGSSRKKFAKRTLSLRTTEGPSLSPVPDMRSFKTLHRLRAAGDKGLL